MPGHIHHPEVNLSQIGHLIQELSARPDRLLEIIDFPALGASAQAFASSFNKLPLSDYNLLIYNYIESVSIPIHR
jgi:hypothetical protein